MKMLIINADDFGADDCRNAGILDALKAGAVTTTSILVKGPAFQDALRGMRSRFGAARPLGLHLNLTEGTPVISNAGLLTEADGRFRGKPAALSFFERPAGKNLEEEIYREICAQIEVLCHERVTISHLDGHHHIHIFPAVIASTLRAAREYTIPWIRLPLEGDSGERDVIGDAPLDREARRFKDHAARARELIDASSLRRTDHFRGLYLKERFSLPALLNVIDRLPLGLTELMVHPGRAPRHRIEGAFSSFATQDRQTELDALMSREFRNRLDRRCVTLTSFGERT